MSIQRYLIIVIISIITLASFGAALQGYRSSEKQLNSIFDTELEMLAGVLMTLPLSDIIFQTTELNGIGYQIWENDQLLLRSSSLPNEGLVAQKTGLQETTFSGSRWRIFVLSKNNRKVIVAQPIAKRINSTEAVLYDAILPMVIIIPIIGLMVFLAIKKSLMPLSALSQQLKMKSSAKLEPISVQKNSAELIPIENTINSLLARLAESFARERRLSSDAAHELRTPISVLKINAHNLTKEFETRSVHGDTIRELNQNVARMAHVIEQIIALNRVNPDEFLQQRVKLDLNSILQEVISNLYHKVELQEQSISLISNTKQAFVLGEEFSLFALFKNLLENASKYGGQGAEIRIVISRSTLSDTILSIRVEDSGSGIEEKYYKKVFERFFRIDNKSGSTRGSGLGLSIVKQIVDLHQGRIQICRSDLGGLCVCIELPLSSHESDGVN